MNVNWFSFLPEPQILLKEGREKAGKKLLDINGHIHTPYSFSAFSDIEQAFKLAKESSISVLGINDFYTTEGYGEFARLAKKYKILPLFNIEFMALQKDLMEKGIRVNDPVNPGRTYMCGKGLNFPLTMSKKSLEKMKVLLEESNRQTFLMVEKLDAFAGKQGVGINFNPSEMQQKFAKNLFRERHIAQAIRWRVFEKYANAEDRKKAFKILFSGKEVKSPLENIAALENEIRSNLLKAGGPAFVEEDPKAFLALDEVNSIILDAGGIPCYPVLLDDPSGNFTEYESDREKLFISLTEKNIWSIELIPGRNDFKILKDFVAWFYKKGFLITFGTEHNTPQLDPIRVSSRGGIPLDDELRKINYEGASVLAAHQYLQSRGESGFLEDGKPRFNKRLDFIELGKAVIAKFTE
jgi:hypothetical protein